MRWRCLLVMCLGVAAVSAQVNFPGSSSNRGRANKNRRQSSGGNGRNFQQNNINNFNNAPQKQSFSSSSCCVHPSQCSSLLFTNSEMKSAACSLGDGSTGLCCNTRSSQSASRRPFSTADDRGSPIIAIRTSNRNSGGTQIAFRAAQSFVSNVTNFSPLFKPPVRGSATYFHAKFQKSRQGSARVGRSGLLSTRAAKEVSVRQGGAPTVRQGAPGNAGPVNFGPSVSLRQLGGQCPAAGGNCRGSQKYRNIDGSCNNLREPRYGMALTSLNRILPPNYGDGIDSARRSTTGGQLPSARLLSNVLTRDLNNNDPRWSVLTMSFGQFVDHDMSHTPVFKNGNQDIDCCNSPQQTLGDLFDSQCLPIQVPSNDNLRKPCMNLARSQVAAPLDCSIRYREQQNQLTHWLDTSMIYGSSQAELRELRSGRSGRMASAGANLLPTDTAETCDEGACFKAGDGRVNEQPGLSLLHTVFLREHNRVAGQLAAVNPGWNDERLFQETKRIVNAEFQHIVYNEWLPNILGKRYMNTYGLFPLTSGFSSDYDPSFDPRINNEFSTAAMRFGHSLIPGIINVYARVGRNLNPTFELKKAFNKPELLRLPGMLDGLIKGFTRDSMQQFDAGFVDDITQSLFDGDRNGMDLVALNIQRGRDHGLPGYNAYRDICGLGRANSFSDFSRQMSLQVTQRLQNAYNNVDDVDLFVGLFSERPAAGAIVGPTTLCIVGDQFARLKKGDRYFYDLAGQAGSFNLAQLDEIRKTSMARIFCDNSNVGEMQPLAFQVPANFNPITSCSNLNTIPRPNLSAWGQTSSNFQSNNNRPPVVRNG